MRTTGNNGSWELFKKFGQLHYLVELDDGYKFKRHIDQLRRSEIQPRKSVSCAPGTDEPDSSSGMQRPAIEELVQISVNQPECDDLQADVEAPDPEAVQVEIPYEPVRRSNRPRRPPSHLQDYIRK
ncbi:conserved repeat domain protein [Lasius niger]|uniref:Conserved repeat domain protein n=1 Tax=Lasius niger TaxID=67767 RepID=A0A0J7KJ95_LASNI|nr:conserved repeat domain protein [Lasius niger]